MKIIFSRKGFDSSFGGCPSPIVDGRPISLPIPTRGPTRTTFGDLREPIPQLVADLTKGRLGQFSKCHLDPDIDCSALPSRGSGWRGALGQVAQAQQHLANQQVATGDLFLFWGLFREVERANGRWVYRGRPVQAIFGWLQIGSIWTQATKKHVLEDYPWLAGHPHAEQGWRENNTIYISRAALSLGASTNLPGFGVFEMPFVLTATDGQSPSFWTVPEWLHPNTMGTGMTYHPEHRWLGNLQVRSAARGQEFVADVTERPDAISWAKGVIEQCL